MSAQTHQSFKTLKRIVSNDDFTPPPAKKAKRSFVSQTKPSQIVQRMYQDCGACTDHIVAQAQHKLIKPSKKMIDAYTMEISTAVRDNNIEKLRELNAVTPRPAKKAKRSFVPQTKPSQIVQRMYQDCGACTDHIVAQAKHKLIKPSQKMIDAYTMEIFMAVRDNNIEKLRELNAATSSAIHS